ncbi:MAG: hypothetical protein KC503_08440 [Myxococcales bacterium]|nr:hypothetical protein [Myxococcales bacterium]
MKHAALFAAVALAACSPAPQVTVTPARSALFGQVRVKLHAADVDLAELVRAGDLTLRFGDAAAVELAVDDDDGGVWASVQGQARPGRVDIVARWSGGERRWQQAFELEARGAFARARWMAIGASWTQGVQANGISPASQRMGPAAQIARAAGAYIGLPLISPTLLRVLGPDDVADDCSLPGPKLDPSILEGLIDPKTNTIELARARLDPDMTPQNVAVGGFHLHDLVYGPDGFLVVMANLVSHPRAAGPQILQSPPDTQIDLVEQNKPDIVVSTDLFLNDIGRAVIGAADDLDFDALPKLQDFERDAGALAKRLSVAAGHVFIGNAPSVDALPALAQLRQRRIAKGEAPADFDAKVVRFNQRIAELNAAMQRAAGAYANIHIVDLASEVEKVRREGKQVGDSKLGVAPYGGLFGLDQLHLSNTGYALIANVFIDAINAELAATYGEKLPSVDLATVNADDPESPRALREHARTKGCVPAEL